MLLPSRGSQRSVAAVLVLGGLAACWACGPSIPAVRRVLGQEACAWCVFTDWHGPELRGVSQQVL